MDDKKKLPPDPDGVIWSVDPEDPRNKPDKNGRYPSSFVITATRSVSNEEFALKQLWLSQFHTKH